MSNAAAKDHSSNPHYNSERNVFLREFIDAKRGNGAALSKIVYGKSNVGFSTIKSGKVKVCDKLWNKIVNGIAYLNNKEKNTFKTSRMHMKSFINDWLKTDEKTKLRLANVVYSLNYTKTKTLTCRKFAALIRNNNFNQNDWDNIVATIEKVNDMIRKNNRFAVAAKTV